MLFSQAKITLPSGTQIDLGSVYESRETHYEIPVFNTGTDSLHIRNVTTSCGCTVAKPRKEFLMPGDSTRIDVTLHNANINGASVRHVYILSNDSTAKNLDVTFSANVLPVLKADPRYISFGNIHLNTRATRMFRLLNTVEDTITVISAKVADPRVEIGIAHRMVPPHTYIEIRVDCLATSAEKLLGEIEFSTSSPLKPVLKVSYTGKIVR